MLLQPKPMDPRLPCLVGDAVHNLRSALDHLVYTVGRNRVSKKTLNDASFTVRKSKVGPNGFDEAIKEGKVTAFGDAWVRFLERVEPYHGGNGSDLYVISKLDNIDKHRDLILLDPFGHKYRIDTSGITTTLTPIGSPVPLKEGVELNFVATDAKTKTQTQVVICINERNIPGLDPNAWAQDTLKSLAVSVNKVLVLAELEAAVLFS
jgi:hypothetical protein